MDTLKKIEDSIYLLSVGLKEAANNQGNKIQMRARLIMMQQRIEQMQKQIAELEAAIDNDIKILRDEKQNFAYGIGGAVTDKLRHRFGRGQN